MAKKNRTTRILYVRTSEGLHRRARVRAAEEDRSVSELVEEAVRFYLDKGPSAKEARHAESSA